MLPDLGVSWAAGRPRTALWIGTTEGASEVAARGAEITRVESIDAVQPSSAGPAVDTVVLATRAVRGSLVDAVTTARERLTDGGHLVVVHDGESDPARRAVESAGLEPLWRDGAWNGRSRILVARRRPEQRKLTLTVGMISMNEEGAVGGVIDAIRAQRPDAEILLVDSSKDATPTIAEVRGARVLRQFPPRGYGPAMTRLLYSATTDVIITMDCDGTYPADRIGDLHERIERGGDLVNASRTHQRPAAMPFANFIANRTFAAVTSVVHRAPTTDVHSGMRAYRTSMLRGVFVDERGPALPVELFIVPARRGYAVEDVGIDYFDRIGATTLHRWDSTVWTFRRIGRAALAGDQRLRARG